MSFGHRHRVPKAMGDSSACSKHLAVDQAPGSHSNWPVSEASDGCVLSIASIGTWVVHRIASIGIWQCVKTNSTPGEHQNSWYCKWMFIPLKMVLIGIDPYPYIGIISSKSGNFGNWKGTLSTQTVAYIQPPQ